MMLMEVFSVAAALCLMLMLGGNLREVINLIDAASLILILVLTVPVLLRNRLGKDFFRAFCLLRKKYNCHLSELRRTLDAVEMMQKQVVWAGIIVLAVSFIQIMGRMDDFVSLGANLAVAVISVLYAAIMEIFLLPLQIEAKRRIIDYMGKEAEEGTDA